jgi:hypothetical protein
MKIIPLTQEKFALVDDQDYEAVSSYKWHANFQHGSWYARRNVSPGKIQSLHSFILPGIERIDHKNQNGLDNRRHNLREATRSQNRANGRQLVSHSSQFKGVGWHIRRKKWQARVNQTYLGVFSEEQEAAKAYDAAAKRIFGQFASLNFP